MIQKKRERTQEDIKRRYRGQNGWHRGQPMSQRRSRGSEDRKKEELEDRKKKNSEDREMSQRTMGTIK